MLTPIHQVMGILQGKMSGDTFIVIDSFALPVEGTETRVNAQVCRCTFHWKCQDDEHQMRKLPSSGRSL